MAQGAVKSFKAEQGFGVIAVDGGGAGVIVHASAIADAGGNSSLAVDQRVAFETMQGPNGPQASGVRVL